MAKKKIHNVLDKFNSLRENIRTGDALFFGGGGLTSDLIKEFTVSEFSHVGIAAWIQVGPIPEKRLVVIESTTLNDTPNIDGEYRKGVQVVLLSQRLESYNGEVFLSPILENLTQEQESNMITWLLGRYTDKTPYDAAQALAAGLDKESKNWFVRLISNLFGFENKYNVKKLFCSELVSEAYKKAGLLPEDFNSSEAVPEDVFHFKFLLPPIRLI